jgi:hypothetical protein
VAKVLAALNRRLRTEGVEADRAIGHAILGIETGSGLAGLRERLHRDVHPLVEEYCYLDRTRIKAVLGDLVDDEGRFQDIDDARLIAACKAIAAESALDAPAEGAGAEAGQQEDDDHGEEEDDQTDAEDA